MCPICPCTDGLKLTTERKLEGCKAPSNNATKTCLASAIENVERYLRCDGQDANSDPLPVLRSDGVENKHKKRIGDVLDRCYAEVKKSRPSELSTPLSNNGLQSDDALYSKPVDALTLAERIHDVDVLEVVKKFLRLQSNALQMSTFSQYFSTCILSLYVKSLKLGPKKKQTLVSSAHDQLRRSNF